MLKRKNLTEKITVRMPKEIYLEIGKEVESGNYKSVADFLRIAAEHESHKNRYNLPSLVCEKIDKEIEEGIFADREDAIRYYLRRALGIKQE